MRIRSLPAFFVAVLCLLPPGDARGRVSGNWEAFAERVGARMPALLKAHRVPGAAVALVQDGRVVWAQGFGFADREQGIPAGPDTVFQVASISKSVTAWGVMHLAEAGRIDLEAPAERYLSRWRFPPSKFDSRQVTVRRLLSHSAGLSIPGYGGVKPGKPLPSLVESLSGLGGNDGGLRIVEEPGNRFRYSGGGYTLLQLIVEEITGEPFADFMAERVLGPLGMSRSGFEWTDELKPLTAAAYDRDEKRLPNLLFTEKAAAGLYSTAADLARFVAAAMPGPGSEPAGRGVLSAESLDRMFAPVGPMPLIPMGLMEDSLGYGLGVVTETLPGGLHALEHGGSNIGWRAHFIFVREKRAGLAVLTNSLNGASVIYEVMRDWGNWLGTGPPAFSRLAGRLNRIAVAGAAALAAAAAAWIGWKAFGRRRARHRAGRPEAAEKPEAGFPLIRRIAWLLPALLLPAGWFLRVKPFLEGFVAPDAALWPSLAVLVSAAAFAAEVIWPGTGGRE